MSAREERGSKETNLFGVWGVFKRLVVYTTVKLNLCWYLACRGGVGHGTARYPVLPACCGCGEAKEGESSGSHSVVPRGDGDIRGVSPWCRAAAWSWQIGSGFGLTRLHTRPSSTVDGWRAKLVRSHRSCRWFACPTRCLLLAPLLPFLPCCIRRDRRHHRDARERHTDGYKTPFPSPFWLSGHLITILLDNITRLGYPGFTSCSPAPTLQLLTPDCGRDKGTRTTTMAILFPRNDALTVNPPTGNQFLTTNGSNWLFTVTTIFGLSVVRHSPPLRSTITPRHGD